MVSAAGDGEAMAEHGNPAGIRIAARRSPNIAGSAIDMATLPLLTKALIQVRR